jgi:hypothetical protein
MDAQKPATTKRRLWLIVIVGGVLLVGWLMLRPTGPKEPSYQGRKLSAWLNVYDSAQANYQNYQNNEATKQEAGRAIKKIGTNAIPTLLKWAQTKDSPLITKLNSWLDKHHHPNFHFQTALDARHKAYLGFQELGNDALPAVPVLIELIESPESTQRNSALSCLFDIDLETRVLCPVIVQLLHSSNGDVRNGAATYLHFNYPREAEKGSVYNMFPDLNRLRTNSVKTNLPVAK